VNRPRRRLASAVPLCATLVILCVALTSGAITILMALVSELIDAHRSLTYYPLIHLTAPSINDTIPFHYVDQIRALAEDRSVVWFRYFGAKTATTSFGIMAISDGSLETFGPGGTHPSPEVYEPWKRDRRGVILVGGIPYKTGWKTGEHVTLHTKFGDLLGVVNGSAGGTAPDKVLMHHAYVAEQFHEWDPYMVTVVYRAGEDLQAALPRYEGLSAGDPEHPVIAYTCHDLLDFYLGPSEIPKLLRQMALPTLLIASAMLLGLLFAARETAPCVSRGLGRRWFGLCSVGSMIGAAIAYARFHERAIELGTWALMNVRVSWRVALLGATATVAWALVIAIGPIVGWKRRAATPP
jgi:hypothetical protein